VHGRDGIILEGVYQSVADRMPQRDPVMTAFVVFKIVFLVVIHPAFRRNPFIIDKLPNDFSKNRAKNLTVQKRIIGDHA
jgi:hypothetical protein